MTESEEKTIKITGKDIQISDGYHTFDELYEHRCLLYLLLVLQYPKKCCFKRDYEEWFCLYFRSTAGQVSYHIPNKYLEYVEGSGVKEDADALWDGHTPADVIERLTKAVAYEMRLNRGDE